jgi:stage II sporulation protein D
MGRALRDAAGVLALLLTVAVAPSPAFGGETVRIAVGRFPDTVVIIGAELRATSSDGVLESTGDTLTLTATISGIRAGTRALDGDVVRVRAPSTLSLRGHRYHRELEVRWRRYDGKPELLVVHPLDLETYVVGIVSAELPQGWPLQAYQAQAVAARTFAVWQKYRRLDLPYHMESSVLDQVYAGVDREHAVAREAVALTRGLVLTAQRHAVQAYFHAACGGRTESAWDGWGSSLPYLPGSQCGACTAAARYQWTARIDRDDVDRAFARVLGEHVTSIEVSTKTKTGRAKTVLVKGASRARTVTGPDARRLLGPSTVWSTWIDAMSFQGDALVVRGKGTGHGVGMCQWGARGFALQGKSFEEILAIYYPGAPLMRLY